MTTSRKSKDPVLDFFRQTFKKDGRRRLREAAVLELVRRHEVSVAKGAELLGLYVGDFVDLMARHGVPYFTEEPRETDELLAQYRALHPNEA